MEQALLLVALFGGVIVSAIVARRLRIPYPIAFVVIGLAFAFIPGMPKRELNPQLLFLVVLPPLLFSGGWTTDWFEFKRNFGGISTLAVGLVLFTTVVVAVLARKVAGFDWSTAFVLGAIVSPPDAVAAEAIFERMAVPRRIVSIVTGEGLVNDGTALVIYRFAVAAAVSGVFSFVHASIAFVLNVVLGIAFGLLVGVVLEFLLNLLTRFDVDDPSVAIVVSLLAPYAAYLPADALGVSGVLAAVAAGIYSSRRSQAIFTPEQRVIASSVWTVMLLLLNGIVFLQIGLILPRIVRSLGPSIGTYLWLAAIVSAAVIVVRFLWVYPVARLRRLIPGVAKRDPLPSWQQLLVVDWSGMRGIVSLAAALALPFRNAAGAPLGGRSEIIFVTLCVIVVTLLLHGLTLGPLIEWLGISETSTRRTQEMTIRVQALQEGLDYLKSIEPTLTTPGESEALGRLLSEYQRRIEHLQGHLDDHEGRLGAEDDREADRRLELAALDAERREIARLRSRGAIPDDVYQSIEYDLDLAGLRLQH
ncbi:MAG: Na+/H+ antiporter [Candidatus Aquilonibacter sp.]